MNQHPVREILRRHPRRLEIRHVYKHVVLNTCLFAAILALARLDSWTTNLCAGGLFAVFSFRAFAMMHECVHGVGHPNSRINFAMGLVAGVFCFLPFRGWRDMHIEHHRWTGNVERDPTTRILLQFRAAGFKAPRVLAWAWSSWFPLIGFMQHVVFWRVTLTKDRWFVPVCVAYLVAAATLTSFSVVALGLVMYLVLVEAVNLPHHLGMRQFAGDVRFSVFEQNRFTRSCEYPRWFAHHVLLNFNLHTAHHMFPAHPWYQLDQLHSELVQVGLQLNLCQANTWTAEGRSKPLDEIMAMTFADEEEDESRAA